MSPEMKAETIRKLKEQNDEHQTAKALLLELGGMELFEKYWEKGQALNISRHKLIQGFAAFSVAAPFGLLADQTPLLKIAGIKFIMDSFQSACEQTADMLMGDDE